MLLFYYNCFTLICIYAMHKDKSRQRNYFQMFHSQSVFVFWWFNSIIKIYVSTTSLSWNFWSDIKYKLCALFCFLTYLWLQCFIFQVISWRSCSKSSYTLGETTYKKYFLYLWNRLKDWGKLHSPNRCDNVIVLEASLFITLKFGWWVVV